MKKLAFAIMAILAASCASSESVKLMEQVDFSHVKVSDAFWSPILDRHAETTLAVCIDQIENQTGRMRNFENAARHEGQHSGIYFDDSDVYKALEGMAYSLINHPNPELEAKADEWIDKFAAAQEEDGYLNTYYSLTGLDKRWTNMDKHEMYCAGHMIEAAVAYYKATGKRKLLDVSAQMVAHMMSVFGPGKRDWVPGHEEIELALVKLYEVTGNGAYLDFSQWLLEERGRGFGVRPNGKPWNLDYHQDKLPVRELADISGHAVRSMYLYCAMADVAALKNDTGYIEALERLWDDVVLRNMYITGGIGSSRHNEGFTEDYDLPNAEAYCETCASVGMVLWNARMNCLSGDSKYADVMERSLYNGTLSGISLSGDRFFYVNPLETDGTHHRQPWYGCACCPSQLCRFLPSLGSYIYAINKDALWVNLFIGSELSIDGVELRMETDYPWDGDVEITLLSSLRRELRIRIPDWCRGCALEVNGKPVEIVEDMGYAVLRGLRKGDRVSFGMDLSVGIVAADPRVKADEGKRAVQRGPLVYCLEKIDNEDSYDTAMLLSKRESSVEFMPELLGGVAVVRRDNLTFIPYYAWDNREASPMKVWVDYHQSYEDTASLCAEDE